MHLIAFAATLWVSLEQQTTFDLFAYLRAELPCPGECRILEASLEHSTGEIAVTSSVPAACNDAVRLEHVPFGAHLFPRVRWRCGATVETVTGSPVTTAPVVTNVEVDGPDLLVDALAEPRGPERLRLHVWAPDAGLNVMRDFTSNDLVLRNVALPLAPVHFQATLEPWGIASNTRIVRPEPPRLRWTATTTGCASTPSLIPLIFFRRRRFPSVRPFC
jgi:hypothetical protein